MKATLLQQQGVLLTESTNLLINQQYEKFTQKRYTLRTVLSLLTKLVARAVIICLFDGIPVIFLDITLYKDIFPLA